MGRDGVVVMHRTFSMVLADTGRKVPIPSRPNEARRANMLYAERSGGMLQYGRHMSVTAASISLVEIMPISRHRLFTYARP